MTDNGVSSVHFRDEQNLWDYYNRCGLSPALTFQSAKCFDYKKATYSLADVFLCTTQSSSGWGFEKQIATDVYFLSFTYAGNSSWEMNKIGNVSARQQLCIVDSSRLVQGQFAAGTITDTIMVDAVSLHNEMEAIQGFPESQRLEFQPLFPKESQAWGLLSSIMRAVKLSLSIHPENISSISTSYLRQALLSSILETTIAKTSRVRGYEDRTALPKFVSRAIDYMHAKASEPIGLAEIAGYSCTSVRNLQLGFKKYKNTSPMRYLRSLRLSYGRAELSTDEKGRSWQEVAVKWGFSDVALFVKQYQRVYGETPFQTSYRAK